MYAPMCIQWARCAETFPAHGTHMRFFSVEEGKEEKRWISNVVFSVYCVTINENWSNWARPVVFSLFLLINCAVDSMASNIRIWLISLGNDCLKKIAATPSRMYGNSSSMQSTVEIVQYFDRMRCFFSVSFLQYRSGGDFIHPKW